MQLNDFVEIPAKNIAMEIILQKRKAMFWGKLLIVNLITNLIPLGV